MTQSKHFQLITFDLDDTLWDVAPVIRSAENKTFLWLQTHYPKITKAYSLQHLREIKLQHLDENPELAHQTSLLRIVSLCLAIQELGYSEEEAFDIAHRAFEVFIAERNNVTLYENARAILAELKAADYRLAALSNGNACIKRTGLNDVFEFAISAESINASKPAPDHFLAAMNKTGLRKDQIVHVGDHPAHDIEAAQALGIKTIWFNPEHKEWTGEEPADAEIASLSALPSAIDKLERKIFSKT
jgi:putative hydrolase of the HAD superfamily